MTLDELATSIEHLSKQSMELVFGVGSVVLIFALWFLWYGLRRDFRWKIVSFFYIVVCCYVFALFFGGGIMIGRRWDLGPLGAIIGMTAFWGIFEVMTYIKLRLKDKNRY